MSTEALGRYMVAQEMMTPNAQHKGMWRVRNKKSMYSLCHIGWYKPWRRYAVMWTCPDAVFDAQCHRDIADFLDKVNAEHKVQKGLRQAAQAEPAVFGAPIPPEEG